MSFRAAGAESVVFAGAENVVFGGLFGGPTVGAKCWNLLSVARGSNKGEQWR